MSRETLCAGVTNLTVSCQVSETQTAFDAIRLTPAVAADMPTGKAAASTHVFCDMALSWLWSCFNRRASPAAERGQQPLYQVTRPLSV